jgi:hypothetical protein
MTKALAMLFFLLSVTMFSIGLYRYMDQFDATIPQPYPPFKVAAYEQMQRKYGEYLERMPSEKEEDDFVVTRHTTLADTRD